jgi:corrinoid protein of di/trimethylamine methyltransferase
VTERDLYEMLARAVIDGDARTSESLAKDVVKAGLDPLMAIQEGLSKGIRKVGEEFAKGMLFLPDLMLAAEATQAGMKVLLPEVEKKGTGVKVFLGRVALGTVAGDIHSIGKSLVGAFLAANNFQVIDLGEDVADEVFIQRARECDILGLSALLTTTMQKQRDVIEDLKEAGLKEKVKVMVGGAVTSATWASEIGADAYGADAATAVARAKELLRRT